MKQDTRELRLMPNSWRKYIYLLLVLTIIAVVFSKMEVISIENDIMKNIAQNGLLLSFILLALTKDKVEDEMTMILRLKAFAISFVYGVVSVIVEPFINLMFDGEFFAEQGAASLLLSMFLFYFIMLFIMKKNR